MATRIGPVLAVIGTDTRGFTDGLSKAQKSLQQFSSTAAIAGVRASAVWAATFGVIGGFALKVGADFELAFANVKKTVDGSVDDFKRLEEGILTTSKEFGIAATEIANIARIGGQLGVATQELDSFTRTIAKLSIAAAELDMETAARGLARIKALSGEGSESIEKMSNVLAKLGDSLATDEKRILDFSVRLTGFASAVGLSSEEILGLSAGFSALVGGTEKAATAVEKFLENLSQAAAEGGTKFEAFADLAKAGLDEAAAASLDFAQTFKDEPAKAIELILVGMNKLGEDGLAPLLTKLDELGVSGVRQVSTFVSAAKGVAEVSKAMAIATKEAAEQTKLQKELAIQLDTVARQFDRLKAVVTLVGINLFKAFKDQINAVIAAGIKLASFLESSAKFLMDMGAGVKIAILGIVGLAGALSILLVVIGTIGGLIVGLSSLMGSFAAALTGTALAAKLASVGLISFSATTGAASIATGAFTVALTAAKVAFTSFILPILAVVVAGSVLAEIFGDMSSSAENLSPPMEKAADELGFFGRITESAKIIMEGFTNAQDAAKKSQEANTKAAVEAGEAIENTGEQFGGFLDITSRTVVEFVKMASGINIVVGVLNEMNRGAQATRDGLEAIREASVKLGAAQFIAKQQGITLAEAMAQMAKTAAETSLRLKEAGEENNNLSSSAENLTLTIGEQISKMRSQNEEQGRVSAAAKFVGKSVDDLNKIMGTSKEKWLSLIEVEMRQVEVAKQIEDAMNKIREAFERTSLATAQQEFKNFSDAVRESMESGKAQTEAGTLAMVERLQELAKAAGTEVPAEFAVLVKEANDLKTKTEKALKFDTQVAAFQSLSDAAAAVEFENFQKALVDVVQKGAEFSEESMLSILKTIEEGVKRSGTEALKGLDDFLKQANALALANAIKVPIEMTTPRDIEGNVITPRAITPGLGVERKPVVTNTEFLAAKALKEELKGIDDQIKAAKAESTRFGQGLQAAAAAMQLLGISSDSAIGRLIGGLKLASKAGADFKIAMLELEKISLDPKIDFDSAAGINAGIAVGESLLAGAVGVWEAGAGGGIAGAIGGAVSGAKFGASVGEMLGPIGAAAGAAIGAGVGLALSLIRGKPEFKKIMEDIGRDWGVEISEELAKEIEATAERLDIGRFEARLLSLGDVIGEAGGVAAFGMEQATKAVGDLFNAVELGVVPAEEGISQIGEVFGKMADEIFEAGKLADSGMLAIIERSRQLGIEVPEITAFITQQLEQAAAGISKLIGSFAEGEDGAEGTFGGIQVASLEDAQAQATIFAAGFFATLQEQGLLAAVDAFEPAFGEMKKKFEEFGADVDFGGISKFFDIASNPEFRPLLEGIQGLTEAMTGLGNAGFLTADTFTAMQQQGGAAFEQLQAAGLSINESLLQMAPFLQEAINASQQFGFALDEDTQKMIEQAEAAGIAFKTDPMLQVVEVLKLIAGELGVLPEKLAGVGVAATESANTTATAYEESSVRTNEAFDGMAMRGEAAYDRLANAGQQSAQETSAASEAAAQDTVASTTMATEQTKMMWAEAKEFVGVEFDSMKENILGNYEVIIESTIGAGDAVSALGERAFSAVSGFDAMAEAAKRAESAARGANSAAGGGGGGGGDSRAGQFGLTTTVNEPTTFLAGEAGEETVTIDPGGEPGGGRGPSTLVLQIDGKSFGKILGDLSRTGDVRIHPSAVEDFG